MSAVDVLFVCFPQGAAAGSAEALRGMEAHLKQLEDIKRLQEEINRLKAVNAQLQR